MGGDVHDLIVLGGGPGGYACALRAASRGLDVVLVERDKVGGTCLHAGCIPSKVGLHAAGVLDTMRSGQRWGVPVDVPDIDAKQLDRERQAIIDQMHAGLAGLLDARVRVVPGRGAVVSPGRIRVDGPDGAVELQGHHVVFATGSVPRQLPGIDVDGAFVQTSDQAVLFTRVPDRPVIVGGGAIGLEFATMWAAMGADVTVVEAQSRLLPLEDHDVSRHVARALRQRGIAVHVEAKLGSVQRDGDEGRVAVTIPSGELTMDTDCVLIAVGRAPRTDDSGATELGVLDDRGYVLTDVFGETVIPGIWAVGDVRPTLALAHAAFAEGFVVADRVAGVEGVLPVVHRDVPRVTFCTPEVASVGYTEAEARHEFGDDAVVVATASARGNARALMDDDRGFVKVVALRDGPGNAPGGRGEILGVHAVGSHATEWIGDATMATGHGMLVEEAAAAVRAHPTHYELVGEALMAAAGLPLHTH